MLDPTGIVANWNRGAQRFKGYAADEIVGQHFSRFFTEHIGPLRQLRDLGVGIAFDDYGTGFASLSLLKRFPLTRLKIDRSFVRDLCTDKEDEAVVRVIAYLAESFGLEVTAESVERDDQGQRLRELGCESAQGFLFGRPMTGPPIMEIMNGAQHDGLARWPHFPPKLADAADETFVKRA